MVCGKIFAVTTKEDNSILSVKYYNEKNKVWITVMELLESDGIFGDFMHDFTSILKVKVMENKLDILHQFELGNSDSVRKPWFIHILNVSIERGGISCYWELLFSKLKDPMGNSPSEFDITNFQAVEL